MKKGTVILATGGTGGHIYPAHATAVALEKLGYEVIFFVDERYKNFVKKNDHKTYLIPTAPSGGTILQKLFGLFKIMHGIIKSLKLIHFISPVLVIGFGGYPSFAPCFAASIFKINFIIHEQNAVLGKANYYLASRAKKIAVSFADTHEILPKYRNKVVLTGNPVRENIYRLHREVHYKPGFNLTIMVVGGSLGASIFSKVIPGALTTMPKEYLKRIKIIQQVRKEDIAKLEDIYSKLDIKYEINSFFNDIDTKYQQADLVISRAGASTISELSAITMPAILVPIPHSFHNHQYLNAKYTEHLGIAWMMEENKDFNAEKLREKIIQILDYPELLNMIYQRSSKVKNNATKNFIKLVEEVIKSSKK